MQVDFGLVPQNRQQQDLYVVAYQCALSYRQYGCTTCNGCVYNIDEMGYDPTEVKLIKARATADASNKISMQKMVHDTELPLVLMAIFMIAFIIIFTHILFREPPSNTLGLDGFGNSYMKIPEDVKAAIRKTHDTIRDVNMDGKLNCIDYAVVFYEIYPNSKVYHCYDYVKFNHLLNKVGDIYVEPQALSGDPYEMWPRQFAISVKTYDINYTTAYATRKQW